MTELGQKNEEKLWEAFIRVFTNQSYNETIFKFFIVNCFMSYTSFLNLPRFNQQLLTFSFIKRTIPITWRSHLNLDRFNKYLKTFSFIKPTGLITWRSFLRAGNNFEMTRVTYWRHPNEGRMTERKSRNFEILKFKNPILLIISNS